ncbi:ExbD/TolR family protein [Beijerinckia indica]|uniref:Biopolymer transport protein ExbD/TolR n=1 Tax=Beijerinckia indica subsp. indica (strain ATCC 9039 / DSM 1715 / NCIMB 8712) TaxID=395963 RepID=B2IG28_BEII9|nr:biopolymer transporter ExbD [Beijerinckia indica]ACB95765.1 Biopolymer transport protein ExbD/TolR [Beijerinckia indica subsp. indica ATCC 9039]
MAFSSSRGSGGGYQPLADINVTPLVDVMLVLLIVFMITAPMLATGVKVNLPQAKAAQPLNPKEPVVVIVTKEGKLNLNADEIVSEQLVAAIQAKIEGDMNHVIHVRGDKDASYGDVIAIMDLLASNGMTHIALLSDPHAKADAAKAAKLQAPPASAPNTAPATGGQP